MKTAKRAISFFLCLVMALSMAVTASAADSDAIAALRAKHPEGSYYSTYYENGRAMAWECMGYAYQLMYEAYGKYLYSTAYENHNVDQCMNNLKAGDVIRYAPKGVRHSIFVTAVDGDTVWYTDSNGRSGGKGYCIVDWDKSTTKSEIRRTFCYATPGLWDLNPSAAPSAPAAADPAAVYSRFLPMKAMLLSNTKQDCYDGYGGAKVGRIYGSDVVTIQEIKQYNGALWCKMSCPWSENGRSYDKTVYAPLKYFIQNTSYTPWTLNITGQYTTYWRSSGSSRAGYTGKGDTGLVVGQSGSRTQIIYPLSSGGYKLAFM